MRRLSILAVGSIVLAVTFAGGCGSDDDGGGSGGGSSGGGATTGGSGASPEQTGTSCEQPSDCYPAVDAGTLSGEAICLDRVQGGYCSHLCETDTDCCGTPGECNTDLAQVCSPFESTGEKMCFLSCEDDDMRLADGGTGDVDSAEFCQREANSDFICRSSGGGSNNRKICVPGDCGTGAACTGTSDCPGDRTCLTAFVGGYCGQEGCTSNADCSNDSVCVKHDNGTSYCLRKCHADTDCSFCRTWEQRAHCADDAVFVEDGTTGSVCMPTLR